MTTATSRPAKAGQPAANTGTPAVHPPTPAAIPGGPVALANDVLRAFRTKDWKRLQQLADSKAATANFFERTYKRGRARRSWRYRAIEGWDMTPPREVRYYYGKGSLVERTEAMVRFGEFGGEVAVVSFSLSDGKWRFAGIKSPDPQRFGAMAKTLAEARAAGGRRANRLERHNAQRNAEQDRRDRAEAEARQRDAQTVKLMREIAIVQKRLSSARTAAERTSAQQKLTALEQRMHALRRHEHKAKKDYRVPADCKNNPLCDH